VAQQIHKTYGYGRLHWIVQRLTGLSVERTGFISREIEVSIFLIDLLVAVDSVLFRVVPHGVVPPIEQWLGLGLVYGIPIGTAGILLNQPGRHIVDLAISAKGIQHDEKSGLMVIQLVDSSIEIRLGGKRIHAPPSYRKDPEQQSKSKPDDSAQMHDSHVSREIPM
jgi:hypothetical protein